MIKIYPASLDKLHEMLKPIRECSEKIFLDESDVLKIELAVEEALVNVINYAYPSSVGHISIHYQKEDDGIRIVIQDRGIPYNPLDNPILFDPESPLEKRGVGGYGIFFILKIMDDVKYRRERDFNILTLFKRKDKKL